VHGPAKTASCFRHRRFRGSSGNGFDFSLKVPAVVVPVQLAQRCFVKLVQNITQFVFIPASRSETGAVESSQRPNQRVAVLRLISPFLSRCRLSSPGSFMASSSCVISEIERLQTNHVTLKTNQPH
jgi:hypothetical protein